MKFEVSILSEYTVLINLNEEVSEKVNDQVIKLTAWIKEQYAEEIIEVVPAFQSLAIVCNPSVDIEAYAEEINRCKPQLSRLKYKPNSIEVPVCYDPSLGIDLEPISNQLNMSVDEIVSLHLGKEYRVYMTGFMPGFLYLGLLDDRLKLPRRKTPRKYVPAGSIGMANGQTGIYSIDSPGGWHIIGQTPVNMLKQFIETGTIARQGDLIKFSPIDLDEFQALTVNG